WVRAQLRGGSSPTDWLVIRANRLVLALEMLSLLGQLLGVALVVVIFVFRETILRWLGMSTVPAPLLVLLALAAAIALLAGGRAVVVGRRSLAGGCNQRLIVTPDGFVVDGGPSRAVPFSDIAHRTAKLGRSHHHARGAQRR